MDEFERLQQELGKHLISIGRFNFCITESDCLGYKNESNYLKIVALLFELADSHYRYLNWGKKIHNGVVSRISLVNVFAKHPFFKIIEETDSAVFDFVYDIRVRDDNVLQLVVFETKDCKTLFEKRIHLSDVARFLEEELNIEA